MKSSPESAPAVLLELVQRLVVALVDRPELVRISSISGEGSVVIEIVATPPEVGQVIGRGGRNIHALQDVVQSVAAKHGIACQVVVLDGPKEGDAESPHRPPFRQGEWFSDWVTEDIPAPTPSDLTARGGTYRLVSIHHKCLILNLSVACRPCIAGQPRGHTGFVYIADEAGLAWIDWAPRDAAEAEAAFDAPIAGTVIAGRMP